MQNSSNHPLKMTVTVGTSGNCTHPEKKGVHPPRKEGSAPPTDRVHHRFFFFAPPIPPHSQFPSKGVADKAFCALVRWSELSSRMIHHFQSTVDSPTSPISSFLNCHQNPCQDDATGEKVCRIQESPSSIQTAAEFFQRSDAEVCGNRWQVTCLVVQASKKFGMVMDGESVCTE